MQQQGKTFTTLAEAYTFASKHKIAWIHKLWGGCPRQHIGFHVVYMVAQ